jgi:hypothetical protein
MIPRLQGAWIFGPKKDATNTCNRHEDLLHFFCKTSLTRAYPKGNAPSCLRVCDTLHHRVTAINQ